MSRETAMWQHSPMLTVAIVGFGVVVGFLVWFLFSDSTTDDRQPLYWVAPMDSNYRRDGPGLSPMGMDLVPVYEELDGLGPGVVNIDPRLQNQLGVRTEQVGYGALKQSIRSFGRVSLDRSLVNPLSTRASGWVDRLYVENNGEAVRQGQPLYSIYSKELIAAQEAFLKALASKNDEKIYTTAENLRLLNVDEVAIGRLRRERAAQQSVVFRAEKDGIVSDLQVSEDQFIEPGAKVMALSSLDSVWIDLRVFESQASLIKPGQYLTFTTPAYPGSRWETEVDYIYPILDKSTQNLHFRAKLANPKGQLKPNMHVQAFIVLPNREPAILVPREAVISLGFDDRVVLSLGEGRYKSVRVTLGETNSYYVEVLEGLEEDDVVVTSAHFMIDSESSKSSDFSRMLALEKTPSYQPTWVKAKLLAVDPQARELKLEHETIEAWGMPSMTMNFKANESLNLKALRSGVIYQVQVADGDPMFEVLDIELEEATK